jgi:hypothetical protein
MSSLKAQEVYPTPFTGRLNNRGDSVRLENNSGRVMDRLEYRDAGDWPTGPDGSGATLAKRNEDTADGRPAKLACKCGVRAARLDNRTSEHIDSSPVEVPLVSLRLRMEVTKPTRNPPPANWRTLDFDDQDWATGFRRLSFRSRNGAVPSVRAQPGTGHSMGGSGIRAHNLAGEPDGRLRNGPKVGHRPDIGDRSSSLTAWTTT